MSDSLPVQHFVPEQTIQCYLDALLQDAAAELALAESVAAAPEPVSAPAPEREPVAVEVPAAAVQPPSEPPAVEQQPGWRSAPFEALLFDVGGLTLAVPLVSLGSIHRLDGAITPLFGQPDWFLGLLPTERG